MISTYVPGLVYFWRLERLRRKIENDPESKNYWSYPVSVDGIGLGN
jgi:hypothetical protein